MAELATTNGGSRRSPWRMAVWGGAALLLLLPAVAMRFTDEMRWDETDFIVMGALLFGAAGAFELAARMTPSLAFRAAVGVAVVTTLLLIWINLAVGIIGPEDNPLNLLYGGVLAVAILGAVLARFRPGGMAPALFATALAQAMVALIAAVAGPDEPPGLFGVLALNMAFAALWLISAALFRMAARPSRRARVGSGR
jgi:MFS family permease